jgi:predicted transcriptional regulator
MLFVDDAAGIEAGMAFVNKGRLVVRNEDAERAREVLRTAGIEPE